MTAQLRSRLRVLAGLRRGEIVLYPTESVWGLGCDPGQTTAVARVLACKQRLAGKGLILVAANKSHLRPWLCRLPAELNERMWQQWPGAHTWVVPARYRVPALLTGGRSRIAMRVSAHLPVRELCQGFGGALVSTSANRSGLPPNANILAVRRQFRRQVQLVWPGALGGADRPTPVQSLLTAEVLRQ